MQVSHAASHITHVVLGGKKTIDFGISDSPEFFAILSSALYKNPKLAMVRETICNAWDAHIDAGITDKPIVVTLDDNHLIIQDFGKGIPDALIGPIYGVYGASTKKNDGRQTGGFGLGCKSPFAYTDHFEVVSCHDGIKTIYNMSKSSAEMNGKPGIVPIASFPTNETGVTVKIPRKRADDHELHHYITQVIFNGDINANYNGETPEVLGLDKAEHQMILLQNETTSYGHKSSNGKVGPHLNQYISVRYGNVIYPIERAEEYYDIYTKVHGLLQNHYQCRLVLLAPPDSLSITPSREALTMTDITADTVRSLLNKFLAVFLANQKLLTRRKELINEYIDEAIAEPTPLRQKLPVSDWRIPGVPTVAHDDSYRTLEDFAKLDVVLRMGSGRRKAFKAKEWFKHIQRYMYGINKDNLFDRGLYQKWARTFQKHINDLTTPSNTRYGYGYYAEHQIATKWWLKNVVKPIVLKMKTALPQFKQQGLFYVGFNSYGASGSDKHVSRIALTTITNHTTNLINLLTPTVILAHNAQLVPKRLRGVSRETLNSLGTFMNGAYFIYEVSRKQDELQAAQEILKDIPGIEVIDLTGRLPHEQLAYEERQNTIAKERADRAAGKLPKTRLVKKVIPGMVRLDNIIEGNRIDTMLFSTTLEPVKITNPEAVAVVSTGGERRRFVAGLDEDISFAISKLYGDKIGISNKSDAVERAVEKGAKMLGNYLLEKVVHDVQNLPSLVAFCACNPKKIESYLDEHADWRHLEALKGIVMLLMEEPLLAPLATVFVPLTYEDQLRWRLWEHIYSFIPYSERKNVDLITSKIDSIPLDPKVIVFLDTLIKNENIQVIDIEKLRLKFVRSRNDPVKAQKLVELLTTLLN